MMNDLRVDSLTDASMNRCHELLLHYVSSPRKRLFYPSLVYKLSPENEEANEIAPDYGRDWSEDYVFLVNRHPPRKE
jgi:hypothetical protein